MAYHAAERVRWLAGNSLPVDLTGIAERSGYKVVTRRLARPILGLCGTEHRVIVLNAIYPVRVRRFTLAHELAELHCAGGGNEDEAWMNQFAGHLLVPLNDLFAEVSKGGLLMGYYESRYDVGSAVVMYQMNYLREWMQYSGYGLSEGR